MDNSKYIDLDDEQLPFSLEAEQSVLGAVLVEPSSILLVADTLKPFSFFYVPQHKAIFEALCNMFELNRTIDFVTLLEWLKKNNVYDDAGGKAYLTQLAQTVPSAANIVTYASIVREKNTRYVRSYLLHGTLSTMRPRAKQSPDCCLTTQSAAFLI